MTSFSIDFEFKAFVKYNIGAGAISRMNQIVQQNLKVLVVDDDDEGRASLCEILVDEGYLVTEACHGADALEILARGLDPAIIVLDLAMPVMDGREFLRHRESNPALRRVPVLVTTASLTPDLDPTLPLLRKPLNVNAVLDRIQGLTKEAQSTRVRCGSPT